jgi:hypothetical protein
VTQDPKQSGEENGRRSWIGRSRRWKPGLMKVVAAGSILEEVIGETVKI